MAYDKQLQAIDAFLSKIGSKQLPADTQVRIYSKTLGIDYEYVSEVSRPFHGASIGKVFVAVLLIQMEREKKISLDQKIQEILGLKYLADLFVFDGNDYSSEVTVRQLATHTSGINDYFDSTSSKNSSFIDQVISQPDHYWTPDELVEYTRSKQSAVSRPGKGWFYSDTGYVLLGKILEKVSGMTYAELLSRKVFTPLKMNKSYLLGYPSKNTSDTIAPLFVKGVDVSKMTSLSCDWSGGGIVTTTSDLLLFQAALHQGKFGDIVGEQAGFQNKFRNGLHYGFGMMELHCDEFFFLLRNMPLLKGHIGITSTHMFYDDSNDVHFIMNFGSDRRMIESFKSLIRIVQTLKLKK